MDTGMYEREESKRGQGKRKAVLGHGGGKRVRGEKKRTDQALRRESERKAYRWLQG